MIPLRDSVQRRRRPLVTIALIIANLVAYLIAVANGGSIIDGPSSATIVNYGSIPYELTHLASHCSLAASGFSQSLLCSGQAGVTGQAGSQPPTWTTAFTTIFINANALAILLNMTVLGLFGATLEDALGRLRFLLFYVLGGLVGVALAVAVGPGSVDPTLGVSGAIAAVLGGYIVLHPDARVVGAVVVPFFFGIVKPAAWVFAAAWLALDVLFGALGVIAPFGAGASYYAPLAAFGFGVLAVRAFARSAAAAGPPVPSRTA